MTISIKARVVGVRPRGDDTFAVTLGPGPNIFWLRTSKPPKLGEYLHVIEAEATRIRVPGRLAVVTMLEGGELEVIPDRYSRRVVAAEWVKRAHNMVRRPFLPHQAEGAGWLASKLAKGQGAILADDPGCVDGDAIIRVCRAGKSFEIKLRDLHYKFHGGKTSGHAWRSDIRTKVRALCGDEFRLHFISDVVLRGRKPVVKITLESGKTLRVTPDHEIRTSNGAYCLAALLKPGSVVVVNGKPKCKRCGSVKDVATYKYGSYPGYCRTCIYRHLRRKSTWKGGRTLDRDGYVLVSGHQNHPRSHRGQVREHILVAEKALGRAIGRDEVVHHKNEIKYDNRWDNLEVKTISAHASDHGKLSGFRRLDGGVSARGGLVVFVPKFDRVVSVKPDGNADVFDIVCDDPHRNFVANGIVVHNCGKTMQALAAIVATGMTPAIVVCPPSTKLNWAREVQYMKPRLRVVVVNGGKGPIPSAHIVIVNYDILRARERQLMSMRVRCIVFDEAHLLKEPNATSGHRAAVATRLSHRIGRVIEMTGTPLLNRPEELWRLLHNIDPRTWRKFSDFRERYCTKPGEGEENVRSIVTKHGKAKHIDELHALVGPYMLRRTREGTLSDSLPVKTRVRVRVDLETFDRDNYKRAEKDVVAWLRDVASGERAAQAKRGQAVVKLTMLRRIAALGKLRRAVRVYLKAWFDANDRQLVIFAYHRQVLEGTAFICRRLGLKVARIRGGDSPKKRQANIDMFREGIADVFIAPIKSAGVGVDGLQCASDVLFLERLWTPALMNQAESRCHRMGQKRPVKVTYLDAADTVDEYIAKVLQVKQQLIDTVVDDRQRATQRDSTIATIDEVIYQIANPSVAKQAG